MSLFNVLISPTSCECDKSVCSPQPIDKILAGERLPDGKRKRRTLVIDFDHSVELDVTENSVEIPEELQFRTGTPMYVARAVVASAKQTDSIFSLYFKRMPTLSAKAKALYMKAHGEQCYAQRCNDPEGNAYHGGVRPLVSDPQDLAGANKKTLFHHRWRHDAEGYGDRGDFGSHIIPDARHTKRYCDTRVKLFGAEMDDFASAFLPEMQAVAKLLFNMARHVLPSYALMSSQPPPHNDHLHEALQSLILEYLVTHQGGAIPLTPGILRATTAEAVEKDGREVDTYGDESKTDTQGIPGSVLTTKPKTPNDNRLES
ncbi:hypothetical protein ONZ51_g5596 [Trametes cubensis]|uniref:Uncharacterized protein n=1 Tax=Trametes cubensis TaxID=1111947 RepID=A0AAD7TU35_9APHY|nr:hypothetical protein ONZ51_g5596 [Trametes cubensis]